MEFISNHVNKTEEDSRLYSLNLPFILLSTLLVVLGLIANIWVAKRLCYSLIHSRQRNVPRHVYLYIGALVFTDIMLLINLPFFLADIFLGQWLFGQTLCKFMYCNESINKLLTSFILAELSFDRLMTMYRIFPSKCRSVSVACAIVLSSVVVSFLLATPLYIYTNVVNLIEPNLNESNFTDATYYKCIFSPPESRPYIAPLFTMYIFFCGFCLPLLFIIGSNCSILFRLISMNHSSSNAQNQRVTWYILMLSAIYLLCWTPYWVIAVFMVEYSQRNRNNNNNNSDNDETDLTYTIMFIHLLPYLNAVLNPISYGYMSKTSRIPQTRDFSITRNETWAPEILALSEEANSLVVDTTTSSHIVV